MEFKFVPEAGGSDRELSWQFYLALGRSGFLIREVYIGTDFYSKYKGYCQAGPGGRGQTVVVEDCVRPSLHSAHTF